MFTTVDIRKLQDRLDEITNKTEVIESEEVAELEDNVTENNIMDPETKKMIPEKDYIMKYVMAKHPEATKKLLQSQDLMDIYDDELYLDLFDYFSEEMPYGTQKARDGDPVQYMQDELDSMGMFGQPTSKFDNYNLKPAESVDEQDIEMEEDTVDEASPEEVTNSGREEDEATRAGKIDRLNVTGSDVAPVAEKLRAEYAKDADEWNARYAELENEVKKEQPGITGTDLMQAVFDYDDDIVSYMNIDDLEDKVEAMDKIIKDPNMDGDDIISVLEYSISDTSPREELMQDFKIETKNMSPEIYSKLFMYDVDESKDATESVAQEGDAELEELKGMLGRSGVMGFTN